MTSDVILQLEGIASAYGKIDAVKGIDLEVKRGQIVTLLGANGAGKTTTLKTISGLVRAKAGRVLFEGNDITGMAAHQIARAGVVHVPEGRHVLRGLSVRENLELGAFTVKDTTLRRDRLEQVFTQFPILRTRANSDGSLLSGGEQQMLAIGRALMHGPKILLLDDGPRAQAGAGDDADRQTAQRGRHHHPPRRAERQAGAATRPLRLCPRKRRHSAGG